MVGLSWILHIIVEKLFYAEKITEIFTSGVVYKRCCRDFYFEFCCKHRKFHRHSVHIHRIHSEERWITLNVWSYLTCFVQQRTWPESVYERFDRKILRDRIRYVPFSSFTFTCRCIPSILTWQQKHSSPRYFNMHSSCASLLLCSSIRWPALSLFCCRNGKFIFWSEVKVNTWDQCYSVSIITMAVEPGQVRVSMQTDGKRARALETLVNSGVALLLNHLK